VLARSMVACCLLLLATGPARPATDAARTGDLPAFLYTAARSYLPLAWMHGEERFPSGAAIFRHDASGDRPLVPDFASSADPAVSFDGQRVLFSGKAHPADPWQIWEVPTLGGKAHRISSGAGDCIAAFYLPDDRVIYARKSEGRFVIEVMDLSGSKPLALTYIPASAIASDVLHDGRIVFSAGYPLGAGPTAEIYTVYSDGSGIESYRCDHGKARHSGKQSGSGDLIFASERKLGRFTSARAGGLPVDAPSAGEYGGGLAEIAEGEWLASWRPDANAAFRIMRWDRGRGELQPLLSQPEANLIQPVLIAPRATPNRHPSGLHDWPNANLLCLNAYTSKYAFAPGSVHTVRVYTRDEAGTAELLGSAPVEHDGSFFVQVPSERPLQIELLDSGGKTLKREGGFFWMRRGEQRGCVGCHAGPETAPENAVPAVLLKSTTPADMTGAHAQNAPGGH